MDSPVCGRVHVCAINDRNELSRTDSVLAYGQHGSVAGSVLADEPCWHGTSHTSGRTTGKRNTPAAGYGTAMAAGHKYSDVQVATRLRTVVSLRCVQVSVWGQSPSPLVWRHHMRDTMVHNSSGRQVVWCRQTTALEQAACFTVVVWQSLPIQKTVENVFVCQGLGCGA